MDAVNSHEHVWSIASLIGYDHPLLEFNSKTIQSTWALLAILIIGVGVIRYLMIHNRVVHFVVIRSTRTLLDLMEQGIGSFSLGHTCFIGTLFIFILSSNILSLVPGLEEPTTDLNTTLALGIISFMYIQITAIANNGLGSYIKGYFTPFAIMLPLNLVGKLSSIISVAFRLFGNIFSGAMISSIYFSMLKGSIIFQLIGILTGMNLIMILFFTLFEGFLQALVFTMLTLTYLGLAISNEGH